MKASKLKRYAEEWQRIEIAVEEAERTGSLQAVSDLLEKECATARREALEEAARALDAIPVVSQNVELAFHMARHAIRTLKYRASAIVEARERGEEPQP